MAGSEEEMDPDADIEELASTSWASFTMSLGADYLELGSFSDIAGTNLIDGLPGDTTTYEEASVPSTVNVIAVFYDLGSITEIGSVSVVFSTNAGGRFRVYLFNDLDDYPPGTGTPVYENVTDVAAGMATETHTLPPGTAARYAVIGMEADYEVGGEEESTVRGYDVRLLGAEEEPEPDPGPDPAGPGGASCVTEVLITSPIGARRWLPPDSVGAPSWVEDLQGGYGEFSLPLACRTSELLHLSIQDRVEVWAGGRRLYRGNIWERARQVEAPDKLLLRGDGFKRRLQFIECSSDVFHEHSADLADIFSRIVDFWVRPVFSSTVLPFSSVIIGVNVSRFGCAGKTVYQALCDLCELSGGLAHWGVDVDPATGKDRLYLRKTKQKALVLSVPGVGIGSPGGEVDSTDLANRLRLTGGEMVEWRQNRLNNSSFEKLVAPDDEDPDGIVSGNLLANPGFESGSTDGAWTDSWTQVSTASVKATSNPAEPDAYQGDFFLELDNNAEEARQLVTGLAAGRRYTIRSVIRPSDAGTSTQARIWIDWETSGGVFISQDQLLMQVNLAEWERFEATFQAPAGTARALIQLKTDSGYKTNYDAVQLFDADAPVQSGWIRVNRGTAAGVMDWASPTDPKHGTYSVKATVSGADTSGSNEVRLRPAKEIPVVPGQKLFLFAWIRTDSNPHAGALRLRYHDSSGGLVGQTYQYDFSGTGIDPWASGFVWGTAPRDAVTVLPEIIFQSDGVWEVDACTLMDDRGLAEIGVSGLGAPGDGTSPYLPDGPLEAVFKAEDVLDSGDYPDANASATTYGERLASEQVSSIVSYPDALVFARPYLTARAVPVNKASLSVAGCERDFATGQALRLVGEDGPTLSGDKDLPIAKIRGSVTAEGLLSRGIEAGVPQPTIAALIRRAAKEQAARRY